MRSYDFDISIISDGSNHNLKEITDYLGQKNVSFELTTMNKRKGKYTFYHMSNKYYYDYIVHYCYFRLSCPHGFDPDDLDLPEKLFFDKKIIYDSITKRYFIAKETNCYFELTHLNNFKNYIIEKNGMMGMIELAADEDFVYSETCVGPSITDRATKVLLGNTDISPESSVLPVDPLSVH
mgnify:CR=1 FL=1